MSNPEKQGNGKAKKFQGYRTNTYIHTPFVFIYLFWAFWHLGSGRSASVGVCEFMAKAPFQRKSKEKRLQYAHANTGETKGAYSSNGQLFSMGLISWFFPAALSGILSGSVSGFVSWDSSSLQTVQVLARPGLSMFSPELFFFLKFLWVVCSCGKYFISWKSSVDRNRAIRHTFIPLRFVLLVELNYFLFLCQRV